MNLYEQIKSDDKCKNYYFGKTLTNRTKSGLALGIDEGCDDLGPMPVGGKKQLW